MGLLTNILNGKYDDSLDRIQNVIIRRRRILSRQRFDQLKIGDHARFVSWIRPTYLADQEVVVVGKKVSKVIVRLTNGPVGRFRGDIRTSAGQLELREEEPSE